MMSTPITVTITGAAGQIGYALLFQIAVGPLFGPTQPIILRLLETSSKEDCLKGCSWN